MKTRQERLDALRKQFQQNVLSPGASPFGGAPAPSGDAVPDVASRLANALAAQNRRNEPVLTATPTLLDAPAGPPAPPSAISMAPKGLTDRQLLAKEQGRAPIPEHPFSFFETDPGQSAIPEQTRLDLEARYSTYDKETLPGAITGGFLPSSVVAEIRPENIDWEKLSKDNQWLSPTDAVQGWMGKWKEIGALGKTDPVAARAQLVEFLKEREASPLTDAAQMFHNSMTDAWAPGTDVNQRASTTGAGAVGNVGGMVAGMALGNPGGASTASEAAHLLTETSPLLAKAPALVQKGVQRALPGAAFMLANQGAAQTAKAAQAEAGVGEFNGTEALKEMGRAGLEGAGFGIVGGAVGSGLERLGEKARVLPAVAALVEKFPRTTAVASAVGKAGTSGLASGLAVGGVRAGIQEAQSPDPNLSHWVQNTLHEGGQNASQEIVQALAMSLSEAIAGRPVRIPEHLKATDETPTAQPEGAPVVAKPTETKPTNEEEYHAAVQELLDKYLQENGGKINQEAVDAGVKNQQVQAAEASKATPAPAPNPDGFDAALADFRQRNPDVPLGTAQELVRSMFGRQEAKPVEPVTQEQAAPIPVPKVSEPAPDDAQALLSDLQSRYPDATEADLRALVEQVMPKAAPSPENAPPVTEQPTQADSVSPSNVLDLTPERRAQHHAKELANLQAESSKHEEAHRANVQSIAEHLAKEVSAENEATRKSLWNQIAQRGKIKPYEDGRLSELTKRIPAHLKDNARGVTLDQIATDLGYESDEALARDILAHAAMKPVKAQDFLTSAEKFYAETDQGRDSHALREYYQDAVRAYQDEIATLTRGSADAQATAQAPGAEGPAAQTERPGLAGAGQGDGQGTSGQDQSGAVGTTLERGGASSVESDPLAKAATYVAGLKAGDGVSLAHVREAAGVTQGETGKMVKVLMDEGLLENKGGKWVRTDAQPAPSLLAQAARLMRNQRGAASIGSKSAANAPLTPAEKAVDAAVVHLADKPTELQKVISDPKGFAAKARDFLVDQFFNDKAAVGDFQKAVTGGKDVNADKDALRKMELLPKVAPGKTEAKLEELGGVLKPLGDKLERFWRYMDARVAVHRADRFGYSKADGNLPLERADAQAFLDEIAKGQDATLFAKTFADLQGYSDRMLDMLVEAGMLTADGKAKIKKEHPDWAPWYRDQDAYNAREAARGKEDVTRDSSGVQAGAGRSPVNTPQGILEQHGSDLPLMDPMERWIRYTARVVGVAERNKVGLALAELSKLDTNSEWMVKEPPPVEVVSAKVNSPSVMNQLMDLGFDSKDLADPNGVIKFFQRGDKDNPVVTVWRDGKQEFYRIKDARLYDAVAKVDSVTGGMLGKLSEWSQGLSTFIRHTATARMSFPVSNLIKDTISAWRLSHNQVYPGQALVEAMKLWAKDDAFIRTAVENGLKQSGYLRPETLTKNMARQVVEGKKLSPLGLWEMYQKVREAPEFWTRLGEASLEYKAQKSKGMDEATATLRALHEGGRITLNFNRKGAFMRGASRHIPFASIPFESALRNYEAAKENPTAYMAKNVLPAIAVAGLVAYLNHGNDRYLQASDDERDRYWLLPVGKGFLRVPNAEGLGFVVANTAERAFRHWSMADPEAFRGYWGGVAGSVLPRSGLPAALELAFAAVTGYSVQDGDQIVPYGLQDLSPGLQSTVKTSPLIKTIGEAANISPVKMEYGLRSVFGGYFEGFQNLEKYVRSLPINSSRTLTEMPSGGPEAIPLLGAYISRPGEGKQGRDVSRFYDRMSEVDTVYNDLREKIARESKMPVKMDQLTTAQAQIAQRLVSEMKPEQRALLQGRKGFQAVDTTLGALRRRRDAILASDRYTAKQKQVELEKITQQISDVATRFMKVQDAKEKGRD